MADSFITLAELLTLNDQNLADINVSDILNDARALAVLPAVTASHGTMHSYLKQTGAPSVGFRAVNVGRENSKSVDTQVDITLKLIDASVTDDKAKADQYRNGAQAYMAREAVRHLKSSLFSVEQQLWYGTGNDADGYAGLFEDTNFDGASDSRVVDAGGTTADTASSVVLARASDDGFSVVIGNEGRIDIGDTVVTTEGDGSSRYTALHTPIMAWYGMQIGSLYDACRIANLTADSGKGLTDDLIIQAALDKFKAGQGPTHAFMSRRSLRQLQQSRTATNQTGAPAPVPEEVHGIKIIVVDSLSDTEALLA